MVTKATYVTLLRLKLNNVTYLKTKLFQITKTTLLVSNSYCTSETVGGENMQKGALTCASNLLFTAMAHKFNILFLAFGCCSLHSTCTALSQFAFLCFALGCYLQMKMAEAKWHSYRVHNLSNYIYNQLKIQMVCMYVSN